MQMNAQPCAASSAQKYVISGGSYTDRVQSRDQNVDAGGMNTSFGPPAPLWQASFARAGDLGEEP
eukprot:2701141-Pleurochrysis_carterae.AAC.1